MQRRRFVRAIPEPRMVWHHYIDSSRLMSGAPVRTIMVSTMAERWRVQP